MKKDKKWLEEQVERLSYTPKGLDENSSIISKNWVLTFINQLDEPKVKLKDMLSRLEELEEDNRLTWIRSIAKTFKVEISESEYLSGYDQGKVDGVAELQERHTLLKKPVIPQFVADWMDTHNLYGNNPLREYRDLEIDFKEGWTDEKDALVYHWINENPYAFIDALRCGYEVEKEPQWVVKDDTGYLSYLQFSIPNIYERETSLDKNDAYKFNSKSKAGLIADLINGTVEEVAE